MLLGNWDRGTSELVSREEDFLCWTDFRPIHIPAINTKGRPIPSPTPRPTLTVSVLELSLAGDVVAGDVEVGDVGVEDVGVGVVREVSELFCGVLKVKLAIVLVVEKVDDVKAVGELELDEL